MEHNHVVYDSDVHFLIDPTTRKIRTEASRKTTVIQYDHNSERFTFDIPRYIEGHDMSKCTKVEVHYLNVDARTKDEKRGVYVSDDLAISETDSNVVSCSWLISSNATQLVGTLNFIVRYCCVEGGVVTYAWNTAVASVAVSTGIDGGDFVATEYADILETWKAELFAAGYINASAMQNEMTVLKSRMDTFASLKDGSTTGDAELQDVRIGADGVTYKSAGADVREQINKIKESSVHMIDGLIPSNYNNLISNVVTPCIFAVMKSGGWVDIPANMASAIIKVEKYNADYLVQTALIPSTMQVYTRIVNGNTKIVYKDWFEQGAIKQVGDNAVLYCIGDSITAGSYSNKDGSAVVANNAEWSYPKRIADTYGCTVHNLGVAGAPITSFMAQANLVGADATIVTITGGANDYHTGKELGVAGTNDTNTVCGVLGTMIESIATKAPLARIVLVSPFIVNADGSTMETKWSREYRYSKFTYDELNNAFKDVANHYCVEYIDGTTGSPTNVFNVNAVQCDGVHPTKEYYATIANWLGSKLF